MNTCRFELINCNSIASISKISSSMSAGCFTVNERCVQLQVGWWHSQFFFLHDCILLVYALSDAARLNKTWFIKWVLQGGIFKKPWENHLLYNGLTPGLNCFRDRERKEGYKFSTAPWNLLLKHLNRCQIDIERNSVWDNIYTLNY